MRQFRHEARPTDFCGRRPASKVERDSVEPGFSGLLHCGTRLPARCSLTKSGPDATASRRLSAHRFLWPQASQQGGARLRRARLQRSASRWHETPGEVFPDEVRSRRGCLAETLGPPIFVAAGQPATRRADGDWCGATSQSVRCALNAALLVAARPVPPIPVAGSPKFGEVNIPMIPRGLYCVAFPTLRCAHHGAHSRLTLLEHRPSIFRGILRSHLLPLRRVRRRIFANTIVDHFHSLNSVPRPHPFSS